MDADRRSPLPSAPGGESRDLKREASGPVTPLLRLHTMRDNEESRKPQRGGEDESPHDDPLAGYTPKQREIFLRGFRILADVAIRAHMGRQAAPPSSEDAEPGPTAEEC